MNHLRYFGFSRFVRYTATLILTFLVLPGCGPKGPALGEVTGKVTINGAPAPGVIVNFSPAQAEEPLKPRQMLLASINSSTAHRR